MTRITETGKRITSTLMVFAACLGATAQEAPNEESLALFSESEADELRIERDGWDPVPRARSAPLGPLIVIQNPDLKRIEGNETIEARSPTSFVVQFEENLAPVDMTSLEVTAKKGLFRKSLTDTLLPFVRGNSLAVDSVEVPTGKFQIQILIKDHEGQETSRTYRLIVEN